MSSNPSFAASVDGIGTATGMDVSSSCGDGGCTVSIGTVENDDSADVAISAASLQSRKETISMYGVVLVGGP
eukprot:5225680-Prymnesium_polylepis.1